MFSIISFISISANLMSCCLNISRYTITHITLSYPIAFIFGLFIILIGYMIICIALSFPVIGITLGALFLGILVISGFFTPPCPSLSSLSVDTTSIGTSLVFSPYTR